MAFIMRTLGWLLYRFRAGETYMTCNMEWVKSKPKSITITSPDFKEGGAIPKKHLGKYKTLQEPNANPCTL